MSTPAAQPEVWLRGPVPGIPGPLQPVAHALLQSMEDAERLTADLDADLLWTSPGGAATVGFHLRHMAGSLDRLLTYARGEALTDEQRAGLAEEKKDDPDLSAEQMIGTLRAAIERALAQLRATSTEELDAHRAVGLARHPSTVRGLLCHAGEHTARHAGQISTTVRVLQGLRSCGPA